MMKKLETEARRRRTFAIISHPDAGKTTLTEKLLLYGGAIHLAGAVRAKANQRHTTSDWMEIEKQRGISVSSSVLQFEYADCVLNLLDTPGHKDFSEDTYRTLAAADAAIMLIDAAKGVEPQTRKLFEVCRMRGLPIFTLINKLDRPARDPFELLDEIEQTLGIQSTAMTWPIGLGDRFRGVYDLKNKSVQVFESEAEANVRARVEAVQIESWEDPQFLAILAGRKNRKDEAEEIRTQLLSELELIEGAQTPLDRQAVLRGELTPVYFASAMNNFGVEHFLRSFIELAPEPEGAKTANGQVSALDPFSGFIFKIQANMDPQHRDRVAFMRVVSGLFERNCEVWHTRLEKKIRLSKPLQFFAQERVIVEQAWPGDIIGLLDTSAALRIGDTLSLDPKLRFDSVPRFSPEFFARVLLRDPLKRKQLKKGLDQLGEEGVVQVYSHPRFGDKDAILGAVGALQFEVLQHRLLMEYGVEIQLERLSFEMARWLEGANWDASFFERRSDTELLQDRSGKWVVLFQSNWTFRWCEQNLPGVVWKTSSD